MNTIEFSAGAKFGYAGKQFIARITGRNPKYTFEREFIGKKEDSKGKTTSVTIDEPGLYQTRDVDSKGRSDDTCYIVWRDGDKLVKDILDEEAAMAAANGSLTEEALNTIGRNLLNTIGRNLNISWHEKELAAEESKDLEEIVDVDFPFASLEKRQKVSRRTLLEARRSELARLKGEAPTGGDALIAEREKLLARLKEIDEALKTVAAIK